MNQQNAGSERTQSPSSGASGFANKSHEAAEQLKDTVMGQADQVRERAVAAREQTAERIRRVANQLRNVGDSLRSEDQMAATVAERASRGIESVAGYVSTTDARGIIRDAEQLARRQPALFFGGAFLLGLAAGRFLKSSSPDAGWSGQYSRNDAQPGRNERPSGFYSPPRPRTATSQQRFKENYDAAFGRDSVDVGTSTRSEYNLGTRSEYNAGTHSDYSAGRSDPNGSTAANGTTQSDPGISTNTPEKGSMP